MVSLIKGGKKKDEERKFKDDKLSPFFSRVGGKTRLRKRISAIIPKESKIYVEPFIGAGSVFLYKRKFEKEVINDLDKGIYEIWLDVKKHGEKIKDMRFIASRDEFNRCKGKKKFSSRRERLYCNLYLSFFSYAQTRKTYIGNKSEKTERFNRDTTGANLKKNAEVYKKRLKNVKIYNKDYEKVVKKYDSKDTFFYLDPPYYSSKEYYKHNTIDPVNMSKILKGIKGKFLLSYDNVPKIRKIFKEAGFVIKSIKTSYKASGQKQGVTELLISNYSYRLPRI